MILDFLKNNSVDKKEEEVVESILDEETAAQRFAKEAEPENLNGDSITDILDDCAKKANSFYRILAAKAKRGIITATAKETNKNIHEVSVKIEGKEWESAQDKAFKEGRSRAVFGKSPHNYIPALAIDIIPEPFKGWNDFSGFNKILNEFQEVANQKKININLGRDFKKLKDYPHIELRDWKRLRYEKDESEK